MSAAPEADSPKTRPSGLRLALLAVVAAALFAGGFAIGRASEDEEPSTEAETSQTAANQPNGSGSRDEYPRIKTDATYDIKDVVDAFPPMIVRDSTILDQEEGTPERALLEWWQAYQFDDIATVERLTAKATIDAIGAEKLRALVALPGPGLQGLEVVGSTGGGTNATVQGAMLNFQPAEAGAPVPDEPTTSIPETFAMERVRGDWLFAETPFLELKLNSLPD